MQGWEKSSYPLSDSKPVIKRIFSTVVILATLSYTQAQYVDVLYVPRALIKCGSENMIKTFDTFSKLPSALYDMV